MKKKTFLQSLKEMDVEFNVPGANDDEAAGGEMTPDMTANTDRESDDKQVEVSTVLTMDSDFFTHLLQSASEMEEDELATVAAELIEKSKTKKVLTMDDMNGYDDDGMDDETVGDELPDETDPVGVVDNADMRPEEECETSGY